MYDSRVGRWLTVDPIIHHEMSPFNAFGNNPILIIDPNGMDTLDVIKSNGKIRNYKKSEGQDVVRIVSDNGEILKSMSTSKGTIQSKWSYNDDEINNNRFEIIQLKDNNDAKSVFEFLGKNTLVEWSHTSTLYGSSKVSFLSTSHDRKTERAINALLDKKLIPNGWIIKKHIHSHPSNTPYPSGTFTYFPPEDSFEAPQNRGEWGDIGFAKYTDSKYSENKPREKQIVYQIFIPKTGKYIPYSKNSRYADFGN